MALTELKMKYPEGFENVIHVTKDELEQQLRLVVAFKLFELGKVSEGEHRAIKFILDYERGECNYTELRKKIFGEKTVKEEFRT